MYEAVADLPLVVEDVTFERRERDTSGGFTRVTTVFELRGADAVGRGEDVTYDAADHDRLAADPPALPTGEYTFDEYSAALGDADLFPEPPETERSRHYRRWAAESAALDLALRQAGTTLGDALNRTYDPVRFVVSTRLGDPPTADRITEWLEVDPAVEFKLDPTPDWDADLIDALAATDAVRVLDFKSHYEDTEVGQPADPALYERVRRGFPDAVLEDPLLTDETRPVLAGAEERLSWDLPVTGVESVRALPVEPRWLNCKPSRFGTVASLFDFLAYCEREGIALYGGGQYELGVGRDQIQAIASLCYPDGPNDVAPRGYNDPEPRADLPGSPLDPPVGFGVRGA
ncbi:MAG: hypothetical protein ABEJ89_03950 [Haloarculaceae archaeon]